jgi:hypothetical protein
MESIKNYISENFFYDENFRESLLKLLQNIEKFE